MLIGVSFFQKGSHNKWVLFPLQKLQKEKEEVAFSFIKIRKSKIRATFKVVIKTINERTIKIKWKLPILFRQSQSI